MVQTVCMPAKWAALCRKLSEKQKCFAKRRRLDTLLDIPSMPIQRSLLESLVENYNPIDRTFLINDHAVPITTWDVYCILGLVDKGEKIEISKKLANPKLFNLYKEKGDTAITFKYLEQRIPMEENEVHFSRMFVLYAIGTILAPSSKGYVGSNHLELVSDVSKIEGLNWAQFTLDRLLENLALFKENRRSGLAGNLVLLQIWYFEHFQAKGDCFDYASHTHPLVKNWPESKVAKRARLEGIKKFGADKVVIHLEPNESKVGGDGDQGIGDQYEGINPDGLRDAKIDDENKVKVSMESMKSLFEKIPEFHTFVQKLVALVDAKNTPTEQCDASGMRKPGQSDSNKDHASARPSPVDKRKIAEKVKSGTSDEIWEKSAASMDGCSGTSGESNSADEIEVSSETDQSKFADAIHVSSGTSDQSKFPDAIDVSSGTSDHSRSSVAVKRKINFVSSPTLVQKVKIRTNRQPSKVCKSPYTAMEHKRVSRKTTKGVTVGEATEGLHLSDLEMATITFVLEELAIEPGKDLLEIGGIGLSASRFKCLVRPVREDGSAKWLCSEVMNHYTTIFNSIWEGKMKHAVSATQTMWLQKAGREWINTGKPLWRCCRELTKQLVGSEMVFLPMNCSDNHWWLCVLYPAANEFQILDSFCRTNYEEATIELRCGIHSVLQAYLYSSEEFESRWSNYNILDWDVVVKKDIPRQHDVCSCGIFTIKYMQYWNGSEITSPFSQKNMETFRKKMPAELILSPLNTLDSIKEHVHALQNFDWTDF